MSQLFKVLAVLLAVGGGIFLIVRAQQNAERPAPASAASKAPAPSATTASVGPTSDTPANVASGAAASKAPASAPASIQFDPDAMKYIGTSKSFGGEELMPLLKDAPQGKGNDAKEPKRTLKPVFMGGTKAPMAGPGDDLMVMPGAGGMGLRGRGTGGEGFGRIRGMGRIQGTAKGEQAGTPAVDVRGTRPPAPASKGAPASKAPASVEPRFMGGTKFDPGSIKDLTPPK